MRAWTDRIFLSKEEGDELIKLWWENNDRKALDRLLKACFPLVYRWAHKYIGYRLSYDDLVSEGMLGLVDAARRYNPNKGVKFQTYAVNWIKAYMLKYIRTNFKTVVSMGHSAKLYKLFWNLRKTINQLEKEGLESTPQAIADRLEIPERMVRDQIGILMEGDDSLDGNLFDKLSDPKQFSHDKASRYFAKNSEMFRDYSPSPEESVAQKESIGYWKDSIVKAIKTLDVREKYIIRMRKFSREPATLQHLGECLDLSRERIRQIEAQALVKIRQYLETRCGLTSEDLPNFSSIHFDTEEFKTERAEQEYDASGFFMKRGRKPKVKAVA